MKLRNGLFLLAILAAGVTHAATLETLGTVLLVPAGADPMQPSPSQQWSSIGKIPEIKWRDREPTPRGQGYLWLGWVPLKGLGVTSIGYDGHSNAAFTADLRTKTRLSPDKYAGMLKEQFSSNVKLRLIRGGCKGQFGTNSAIYEAVIPGKRPLFLLLDTDPSNNGGNTTIQLSGHQENRWAC